MATFLLFAPLVGALLARFGSPWMGARAAVNWAAALLTLAASVALILYAGLNPGEARVLVLARWIDVGTFGADWALRLDRLSLGMAALVSTAVAAVMATIPAFVARDADSRARAQAAPRLAAGLALALFAMLLMLLADNLVQMLVGFVLLGWTTALLTGVEDYKTSASSSGAIRAFTTHRVADVLVFAGAVALYWGGDSLSLETLWDARTDIESASLAALLIALGALVKAGLLGAHGWLAAAGRAPAPAAVSVIGLTTTVAAVALVLRLGPLVWEVPLAQGFLLWGGLAGAVFGAGFALAQLDIGRLVAYLAMAQAGVLFALLGLGDHQGALRLTVLLVTVFVTLFLAVGAVVNAMEGERDLRNLGGLRRALPVSFASSLMALAALGGAGALAYWSMLRITPEIGIRLVFGAYVLIASAAAWRLVAMVFMGKPRGNKQRHKGALPPAKVTRVVLVAFGAAALVASSLGFVGFSGAGEAAARFTPPVLYVSGTGLSALGRAAPFLIATPAVIVVLWFALRAPAKAQKLARRHEGLVTILRSAGHWDLVESALTARPARAMGDVIKDEIEPGLIDAPSETVSQEAVPAMARFVTRAQTGSFYAYGLSVVVGLALLLVLVTLFGARG